MSAANSTLTQDRLKTLIDYNPESGIFVWISKPNVRANRIKIGSIAGSNKGNGYIQIQIDGKNYLAQRLAFLFVYGQFPRGEVDHIDGCRNNNKLSNLRDVTHAENIQNQLRPSKASTTRLMGVSKRKDNGKYSAYIMSYGKRISLGSFSIPEDAHEAYLSAKRTLHPGCTI